MLPKATPNTNAGTAPPTARPQSQDVRHLVFSNFCTPSQKPTGDARTGQIGLRVVPSTCLRMQLHIP